MRIPRHDMAPIAATTQLCEVPSRRLATMATSKLAMLSIVGAVGGSQSKFSQRKGLSGVGGSWIPEVTPPAFRRVRPWVRLLEERCTTRGRCGASYALNHSIHIHEL